MPTFTLSICIPTHNSRCETLNSLLDCVGMQCKSLGNAAVQVCVSDNASTDGTAAMISKLQEEYPVPLKYFRFDQDMGGVRNFLNVVDISDSEYCWLIGSDDMLLPQGIAKVLANLGAWPGLAGLTVNKLNFDKTLTTLIGPDHDLVLPTHPTHSRALCGVDIADNLGISFTYMSSHIFRRESWRNVVEEFGRDRLCSTRHFPHTYIFLRMAEMSSRWYWFSENCVIQRMGNFCILDENENFLYEYADEFTHDLIKVWDLANIPAMKVKSLLNRLYFIFWNPVSIFAYYSDRRLSLRKQKSMITKAISRFGGLAKFWIFSFPILIIPAPLCRSLKYLLDLSDRWIPVYKVLHWLQSIIARGLSFVRRFNEGIKDTQLIANEHIFANNTVTRRCQFDTPPSQNQYRTQDTSSMNLSHRSNRGARQPDQRDLWGSLVRLIKSPIQKVLLRILRDVHNRIDNIDSRLSALEHRFPAVERRVIDWRRFALEEVNEYLQYAMIDGDYCEFGVAYGHAFVNAYDLFSIHSPSMRFHAFDSFEGLPRPQGVDAQGTYTGAFHEGQFACSLETFTARLRSAQIAEQQVTVHQGWFDRTLAPGQPADAIASVAVAWVDCDLYESTVPVLNFLASRLQPGSVVVFDDWGCYRNQPDSGEQRACREWLDANPQLRLSLLFSYGWTGRVFTVSAAHGHDHSPAKS